MGANFIRVNPASLQKFGGEATTEFGSMRSALQTMVDSIASTDWAGANGATFKTTTGQAASEYAGNLLKSMQGIAEAVRTQTTNVSTSLGGAPVAIQVDGGTVTAQAHSSSDDSQVTIHSLDNLKSTVTSQFSLIDTSLGTVLSKLSATDWQGNAKERAVQEVNSFVTNAKQQLVEARTNINNAIQSQADSVAAADV